jgi:hypothetical protein
MGPNREKRWGSIHMIMRRWSTIDMRAMVILIPRSKPKIDKIQRLPVFVEAPQHVLRFQITMDIALAMKRLQSIHHLFENFDSFRQREVGTLAYLDLKTFPEQFHEQHWWVFPLALVFIQSRKSFRFIHGF